MNFAACWLVFAFALPLQDKPAPAPDPKRIESAVVELTAAFGKDATPQQRVDAIGKSVDALDARVIEWIAKGLQDKESSVVLAAVDALGKMQHPDALDALHAYAKREKRKLAEDEALFPLVLKAIGRHGNPASIALLSDDPFSQRSFATVQARIYSLGNIRSKEAVEALIAMSRLVGPHRMEGTHNDFRVALARLTGRDLGPGPEQWAAWWNENKKSAEIAKQPPKLDLPLQRQWDRYWGTGKEGEDGEGRGRGKRRGGEGGTPPDGGQGGGEKRGGG